VEVDRSTGGHVQFERLAGGRAVVLHVLRFFSFGTSCTSPLICWLESCLHLSLVTTVPKLMIICDILRSSWSQSAAGCTGRCSFRWWCWERCGPQTCSDGREHSCTRGFGRSEQLRFLAAGACWHGLCCFSTGLLGSAHGLCPRFGRASFPLIHSGVGCDFKKSHILISGCSVRPPHTFRGRGAATAGFSSPFDINWQPHRSDLYPSFWPIVSYAQKDTRVSLINFVFFYIIYKNVYNFDY